MAVPLFVAILIRFAEVLTYISSANTSANEWAPCALSWMPSKTVSWEACRQNGNQTNGLINSIEHSALSCARVH
jgi:hypothetical protein